VFITADPHIRVISEGSRDTDDWSNDADHRNKLHYIICSNRKQSFEIV